MRNPAQLEFDFEGKGLHKSDSQKDAEIQTRLKRCSVFSYCWSVENGHKAWADLMPPSTQDLRDTLEFLQDNPETFGQHYRETLQSLLHTHAGLCVVESQRLRAKFVEEDLRQGVHITDRTKV